MANITPAKGLVLVKWIEENNVSEGITQNSNGSVSVPTSEPQNSEPRLAQLEVLSGTKAGQIALASEWQLTDLLPGTANVYFISEDAIRGYSDAPISGELANYEE